MILFFIIAADFKKTKETNKELRMNLEKKSKQLALEQQKSKSFLLDLARIRKVTAEELKNTVSLVSTNLLLSCNIFSIYFHLFIGLISFCQSC